MKRIAKSIGIDRAVCFTLLARGWNVAAGLLTIVFIAHFLSPALQGYYYTFNSLIALQIFIELGLNIAIVQFASHEMSKLAWMPDGTINGNPEAKRRLQSLMHFAFSWFGIAAVLMITLLLPIGLHFFDSGNSDAISVSSVRIPWALLVIFTAVNLFVTAAAAILEGCGKVAQVAVLRLLQLVFAMTLVWIILSMGGSLYALTASSMMMAMIGFVWLWINYRVFFKDLFSHRTPLAGMNWRSEIWPFQWRIAVSWMSGYLMFQLFTPLLFKTHGPIVAGQMGMSLQIISAMNGVAMAWITTKTPTYGKMVATNQRKELDALFTRGFIQSFGFLVGAVAIVWVILYFLIETASPYAIRVLPLHLFTFLCLVCLANHILFVQAAYLRAHKKEPFMILSVLSGLVTSVLTILLVPRLGAEGAVYSYTTASLLIGLVGGTFVFVQKRKEWTYDDHH